MTHQPPTLEGNKVLPSFSFSFILLMTDRLSLTFQNPAVCSRVRAWIGLMEITQTREHTVHTAEAHWLVSFTLPERAW